MQAPSGGRGRAVNGVGLVMNTPDAQTGSSLQVVPPASCRVVAAYGDEATFHLGAAETGGKYTMFTLVTPPGSGPPPHVHANEDEWFLVLEGEAEFFKDGSWLAVSVGTAIFAPRGVEHAFRNVGQTPLRMLLHTAPSGFEEFFARSAEEFAKPGEPDMAALVQIAGEHGITFTRM